MGKIQTAPEISILDYADAVLETTGQYDENAVKLRDIDNHFKLTLRDEDLKKVEKLPEVGEQLALRGILDIDEKEIVLDVNEDKKYRKRFSHAHEIGHFILPHHRDLLYKCSEQDMLYHTLQIIEKDANQFAASLLFKGSLFSEVVNGYDHLAFSTIQELKDKFSTSITSTLRRSVEICNNPVAAVFINIKRNRPTSVGYTVTSRSFRKNYFKYIINISDVEELFENSKGTSLEKPFEKPFIIQITKDKQFEMSASFFYNSHQLIGILAPIEK